MLPQPHRLPAPLIGEVMRRGKRLVSGPLQMVFRQNNLTLSRFAFIVSTNVDKRATVRNRFKRLLRESVHRLLPSLQAGWDVVVIVRTKPNLITFDSARSILQQLFDRAGIELTSQPIVG